MKPLMNPTTEGSHSIREDDVLRHHLEDPLVERTIESIAADLDSSGKEREELELMCRSSLESCVTRKLRFVRDLFENDDERSKLVRRYLDERNGGCKRSVLFHKSPIGYLYGSLLLARASDELGLEGGLRI